MGWIIVCSIIALPLVEIAIFLKVVDSIGILPTVAGALLSGIAGVALWRSEGTRTLARAQSALTRGEMPVDEVFDGLCLLVAGALLLLPGFLTDVMALILLLPPVRGLLRRWLAARLVVRTPSNGGPPQPPLTVIDAEYQEVGDDDQPSR